METLASVWARDPRDPRDLGDLGEKRHEPPTAWEPQCLFNDSPPAGLMWTEQLSPHLQRNKQLQDTLLQREEELARLQEENNKLREFLGSSFVRNLEEKAKKLTTDGRRKLKRNLIDVDEGPFQNCAHQLMASQQVSKRVCRNLTAEFCSESAEAPASSEPNLDLWVLRTLGLKDRDTIDTSSDSLSSPVYSLRSLVHDAAVTSSSSSGVTLTSFSPSAATSASSSANSYCQSSTRRTDYRYSAAKCQEANCANPARSAQNCTTSPSQCSDFTATAPTGQYEAPEAAIRSYNTSTAFQSPLTEEFPFTQSPDRAEVCRAQTLEGNPAEHPAYWASLRGSRTPSQDTIQFSPPGERIHFSPISSSSPVTKQTWTPVGGCSPTSPSAGSQPPATPQTPRSRTDLAFSMSLSPSSSVKTHSFPQGQAFIRKDTEGRWNFTWVPRQGP
ncbi:geminin coiled-coil domain-containing protein 1 [Xiphias gladius]|uniref:geminin coiled-coil domain-containing protein 1 n=1 Tax=Xiphias gladius TaxID=8245 RepID=UPI001A98020B|nr:geminin coiled-coil domain-containing protein 1 [Xiphias gladius]